MPGSLFSFIRYHKCLVLKSLSPSDYNGALRWEFIKENKKVRKQENTLSTKKAIKKKIKKEKKENMLSTKKALKKKR